MKAKDGYRKTRKQNRGKTGQEKTQENKTARFKPDPRQKIPPVTRCWLSTCLAGAERSPETEQTFPTIVQNT